MTLLSRKQMCIRDRVESEPNRGSSFEVILNLKIVENRVVSSTEQIEMHETDSDIPVSYTHLDVYKRQESESVLKITLILKS